MYTKYGAKPNLYSLIYKFGLQNIIYIISNNMIINGLNIKIVFVKVHFISTIK